MSNFRNVALSRALSAHDAGDFDAARMAYSDLLSIDPLDPEANFFLGLVLLQTGAPVVADQFLGRAVILRPGDADSWNYLGLAQLQTDRGQAAVSSFSVSGRCDPVSEDAFYNAGVALLKQPDIDAALANFRKAAVLEPASWKTHNTIGSTLIGSSYPAEAESALTRASRIAPDVAGPLLNLGRLLQDQRRWADALVSYESAAYLLESNSSEPSHLAAVLQNQGIVLTTLGRAREGRLHLGKSIVLTPDSVLSWNNYGNALKETRSTAAAMTAYDRAQVLDPNQVEAAWNKALLLLLSGDLVRGFDLYETRWQVRELFLATRQSVTPKYSGTEAPTGRHFFLFSEQGYGDTLQFCRFSKRLLARGARVTLEVPSPLVPLLRQSEVASVVVARGGPEPVADYQCALMSLPAAWGYGEGDIGMDQPYLRADPGRIARWGDVIQREEGVLNIGICWKGGAGFRGDAMRSLDVRFFSSIAKRDDLVLYSLQKDCEGDESLLASLGIACFDEDFDSDGAFLDSIAVLEHLDLVITVDTAIAHLAAAAGKPTWIILAHVPDWRWMLDREDSPWYPSVRLFRQGTYDDWAGAFADIECAIDGISPRVIRRLST
jgi:tetratricopeptide (TPR) repeat protein